MNAAMCCQSLLLCCTLVGCGVARSRDGGPTPEPTADETGDGCAPETHSCIEGDSYLCSASGDEGALDASCGESGCADGFCLDPCGEAARARGPAGCFYRFDLPFTAEYQQTVVLSVANPAASAASATSVTIEAAGELWSAATVPPGETVELDLPGGLDSVFDWDGGADSHLIGFSVITLAASQPVLLYLHHRWLGALEYGIFAATTDAMEVRPTHSWGHAAVLFGEPSIGYGNLRPTLSDTLVRFPAEVVADVPSGRWMQSGEVFDPDDGWSGLATADGPVQVLVDPSQVLRLATFHDGDGTTPLPAADLTGTRLTSRWPLQSLVYRRTLFQPWDEGSYDLAFANVPARDQWAREYVLAPPPTPYWWRGTAPVHVQLVADADPVTVTLSDGQVVEVEPRTGVDVRVDRPLVATSDGEFLAVMKLLTASVTCEPHCAPWESHWANWAGDPSYLNILPPGQWPQDALFAVPPDWPLVFVTITAEMVTDVVLDGEALELSPIADGRYGTVAAELDEGVHRVQTPRGNGASVAVVGYGFWESYAHTTAPDLGPRE